MKMYNRPKKKTVFTDELKRQVRDLCGDHSKAEIAKIVGIAECTVQNLCQRQGYSLKLIKKVA